MFIKIILVIITVIIFANIPLFIWNHKNYDIIYLKKDCYITEPIPVNSFCYDLKCTKM